MAKVCALIDVQHAPSTTTAGVALSPPPGGFLPLNVLSCAVTHLFVQLCSQVPILEVQQPVTDIVSNTASVTVDRSCCSRLLLLLPPLCVVLPPGSILRQLHGLAWPTPCVRPVVVGVVENN